MPEPAGDRPPTLWEPGAVVLLVHHALQGEKLRDGKAAEGRRSSGRCRDGEEAGEFRHVLACASPAGALEPELLERELLDLHRSSA